MDFPKSVPGVGLVNGKFVDEDPLATSPGSLIPSAWGNSVTAEILAVIKDAGLEPDESNVSQLSAAINKKLDAVAVSFATQQEAEAGTSTAKVMSPLRVFQAINKKLVSASETVAGLIGIATASIATGGTNDAVAITPAKAKAILAARGLWDNSLTGTTNANLSRTTGLYAWAGAINGPPDAGNYQVFSSDWGADPTWQSQLAMGISNNSLLIRSIKKDQSTATPWARAYTNADFSLVGASVGFYLNSPPVGWLKENGAAVSRTTYAALFAIIGTAFGAGDGSTTFNLPDHRGEFPRGTDDSRGVDPGRLVGSTQAQGIQSHAHTIFNKAYAFTYSSGGAGGGNAPGGYTTGATEATGGTETRPRNIAKLYCIKF